MKKGNYVKKLLVVSVLGLGVNAAYAIDGAAVYHEGTPKSCADCHGKDGAGYPRTKTSRKVPAIAGLPSKTIEVFLNANKRGYVKDGIKKMHERAKKLNDDEILAVAKYVENLHKDFEK
jgi:cytochrome c553